MFLYGASGHARVIREILEQSGASVSAFVDDDETKKQVDGLEVLHSAEGYSPMIIAIGDSNVRYAISKRLGLLACRMARLSILRLWCRLQLRLVRVRLSCQERL